MSQKIVHRLLRISAFCLIEILAASAQNRPPVQGDHPDAAWGVAGPAPTAKADIPFEFWIGPERMPPGRYTLQMVVPSVDIIRSVDGKVELQFFVLDIGESVPEIESKLVFIEANGKYMLFELWSVYGKRRLSVQNPQAETEERKTREVRLIYPRLDSGVTGLSSHRPVAFM